jgi:hypothetical protein
MTAELLIAIALLCQIPNGDRDFYRIKESQKSCQKELITCVSLRQKGTTPAAALGKCIAER